MQKKENEDGTVTWFYPQCGGVCYKECADGKYIKGTACIELDARTKTCPIYACPS